MLFCKFGRKNNKSSSRPICILYALFSQNRNLTSFFVISLAKQSLNFYDFFCKHLQLIDVKYQVLLSIYGTEYTPISSSYFTGALACTFSLSYLYFMYVMGIQTFSKIIQEVCQTIWEELQLSFMSVPSQEDWLQISPKFEQCANFPNCIGRIGGKHFRQ